LDRFFELWIRTVIVLNAISLVLYTVDAILYVSGDRNEVVIINEIMRSEM